jgi:hypothetical protein
MSHKTAHVRVTTSALHFQLASYSSSGLLEGCDSAVDTDLSRAIDRLSGRSSRPCDQCDRGDSGRYRFQRQRFDPNTGKATGKRRLTPAMASGIVDSLWTFADLYEAVMWN